MENGRLESVKVFQILVALPADERKRLRQYLLSPYFQVRRQLIDLYELLVHARDSGEGEATLRSEVYFGLFPQKRAEGMEYLPKMDSHLRKLLSDLKLIVDQFLLIEGLVSRPDDGDLYLCQAYRKLGLDRHFELKVASAIEAIPLERSSSSDLRKRIELETMQFQYQVEQRKWDSIKELPGGALMVHFHVERYKQLCKRINVGRVLEQDYPFRFGDAAPSALRAEVLDAYPVTKFYVMFYDLLLHDAGDFEQLRKLTVETCMAIDREECQQMFNYLQNYCSGRFMRANRNGKGNS